MDESHFASLPARARRVTRWLASLVATTLLMSCGGGGYGGGAAPNLAPPSFSAQPADVTVAAGQPATFSVSVAGYMPMSFQWQRDGVDIAGATQTSYTLASATPADDGAMFRVRVSNLYGSVTSTSAALTVN